jgi:hypothetical protein
VIAREAMHVGERRIEASRRPFRQCIEVARAATDQVAKKDQTGCAALRQFGGLFEQGRELIGTAMNIADRKDRFPIDPERRVAPIRDGERAWH